MNLVVNARDAMPDGGRLLIRAETMVIAPDAPPSCAEARPGSFVRLTISDTGSGMDEATLKHMFEPFFTTKDPSKGTGLGLATVFGIVKQHQGWIEVESRPKLGTTFRVLLPAAAAPDAPQPMPRRDQVPHGNETILLVEDEHQVRNTLAAALRRLGYRVLEAPHAVAALPVWAERQQEIQLLLTDMVMPEGMNGLQLTRRLRSDRPDLPVILCSGYSQETANLAEASLHEVTFLPKPFELRRLAEVIRLLLKKS
jgi:CheY-like chemotaxis protein